MPAYYCKQVASFLRDSNSGIVGDLVAANSRARFLQVEHSQTDVWQSEIEVLQSALREVSQGNPHCANWGLALEFPVPRRLRRADVVVLAGELIVVLEFKTGVADLASVRQVEEYALDLRDFHSESLGHRIQPAVVSCTHKFPAQLEYHSPEVQSVRWIRTEDLSAYFEELATDPRSKVGQIDCNQWNTGAYRPVPTIIEAALAIFAGMEVREIAHAHADPINLTGTVDALVSIVERARNSKAKTICFVTGVPGSGKTLAGLRAVHDSRLQALGPGAISFLSGNGPLVRILREALLRDRVKRQCLPRLQLRREVETLIQNVHGFAAAGWEDEEKRAPVEKIVVFDEAQRAWDADRNRRKFKRDISEPNMLLEIMNRHQDWCVMVALVGGGQEIHDGEAGLAEWGRALLDKFPDWHVYASTEALVGGAAVAGRPLFAEGEGLANTNTLDVLHLSLSFAIAETFPKNGVLNLR
jgi:hypothetical protein